ncbi:MAG TPA: dephospho-CoA kinase [Caulobacteraceae bacterium]
MIVLGLTGSIGMGKSTTAGLFRDEGVPVQDADQVVADLYAPGGAAVMAVGEAFPGVIKAAAVDRAALSLQVLGQPEALTRLETIVHPLVRAERERFLQAAEADGAAIVVLEVQLLFEVGVDAETDATVVVSASETVQRGRVLARPGMTAEKLGQILARQIPDAEKRDRADFVIDTGRGIDAAREQVKAVLAEVRSPQFRPRRSA